MIDRAMEAAVLTDAAEILRRWARIQALMFQPEVESRLAGAAEICEATAVQIKLQD